jgi:hypothetical protein
MQRVTGLFKYRCPRSTGTTDENGFAGGVQNSARRKKVIWKDRRRVKLTRGSLAKAAEEGKRQGGLGADFTSLFTCQGALTL